jgi:hypothetical protein
MTYKKKETQTEIKEVKVEEQKSEIKNVFEET